jgi:hypothetical protein
VNSLRVAMEDRNDVRILKNEKEVKVVGVEVRFVAVLRQGELVFAWFEGKMERVMDEKR